jgi:flagellar biosynthetic protein FliR
VITISGAQLNMWVAGLIWPLTRILGLIAAAPVFGHSSVPLRQKIGLGLLITVIVAPLLPPSHSSDPFSLNGMLIMADQFMIGLAMGFAMRIVFASIELAGEVIGLSMGLNFATFFDPQSQGESSVVSQFFVVLGTLIFLAANGHLLVLSVLAESFQILPIASSSLGTQSVRHVAELAGVIFSSGLQLSLPVLAALLVTSVSLGILTRAAPQLNIFGVGFPISIGIGLLAIALALPYITVPLEHIFQQGLSAIYQIAVIP